MVGPLPHLLQASPERWLQAAFRAGVDATSAGRCLPAHVPQPVAGRTVVVGAGKAAAAMAAVFESCFDGRVEGVVAVPDGHEAATAQIAVIKAAHPVSDARSVAASQSVLARVAGLTKADQLVVVLSGGGSALLCLPPVPVSLVNKQALVRDLLASGADISEVNCVRKHVSRIKGGRLALAAWPARCLTLAISDVPGDDPSLIASGPTVADLSSRDDAARVLKKYGLTGHREVMAWLARPESESPSADAPAFAGGTFTIIARGADALSAVARVATDAGIEPVSLGNELTGRARDLANQHAQRVLSMLEGPQVNRPCLLISGGETTVRVTGSGSGGRNGEYLLALLAALGDRPGIYALAADSDGIDGSGDSAGAWFSPATGARACAAGLRAEQSLADNDSYGFFNRLGTSLTTGPTRTNVNDIRMILLMPEAWQGSASRAL